MMAKPAMMTMHFSSRSFVHLDRVRVGAREERDDRDQAGEERSGRAGAGVLKNLIGPPTRS